MENEKCRILVADDEPIERMVISKVIQGYFGDEIEIWQAENGREAIEVFQKQNCRIAILDISMPGINGLDAAEEIRKKDAECSIIFLTAYDEFDYAKRAIRVHALDYLLKPSTKEELIAVLEEAVYLAGQGKNRRIKPILTDVSEKAERPEEKQEVIKNRILAEQIREYIETHYMEDICLQDVAVQFRYSDAYFCRFFKQNFDKNFIVYLSELRIEKAKELLADVTVNIKDIGQEVGYRDSSYFTKVFKRIVGVTPSEYRYG